jgi:hypothetical protein
MWECEESDKCGDYLGTRKTPRALLPGSTISLPFTQYLALPVIPDWKLKSDAILITHRPRKRNSADIDIINGFIAPLFYRHLHGIHES